MLEGQLTGIVNQLKEAIGRATLRRLGDESGFVIRERAITADRFVPSLIKSLGSRRVESIADLVRDFNFDHDLAVHYKPYYEKLNTPCFSRLMHHVFESMLSSLCLQVLAPLRDGPFARFRDIVIQDGTSFALQDRLVGAFRGRFTTLSPAAVELHCTMSVFSDNLETVVITGDAESERNHLPEPADLKDKMLLGDRGYDSTAYMLAVNDEGGFFLIRVRKCLNPRVIKIYRQGQRYRQLEGRRLRTVLRRLPKDQQVDMDVGWEDREDGPDCSFRLVVCWNPVKKDWIRLMTNLDRVLFSSEEVLQTYRLRWQIELLFKELKSYANLHKFWTTKEPIAEGLMWASLCAAFLKRYLAHAGQRVLGTGAGISTRRVAMCAHNLLIDLCRALLQSARGLAGVLRDTFRFFAHNARRSNRRREIVAGRLALGLRLGGAEA